MLRFENISAAYRKTNIIKNISIDFKENEITTILGPNGCGKSTVIQCLNEMVTITGGTIYLDGIPLHSTGSMERAKHIAILPQFRSIIPSIPAKTLVEHGRFPYLGFLRRKSQQDEKLIEDAMKFSDTLKYQYTNIDQLSGGERQRVFFAMTLAQDCEYIVMDEPTTFLDIYHQHEFLDLVRKLKMQGKTIILILHDLAQAIKVSDSLVIMKDGCVITQNTPKECLESNIIDEVFGVKHKVFKDEDGEYIVFH